MQGLRAPLGELSVDGEMRLRCSTFPAVSGGAGVVVPSRGQGHVTELFAPLLLARERMPENLSRSGSGPRLAAASLAGWRRSEHLPAGTAPPPGWGFEVAGGGCDL